MYNLKETIKEILNNKETIELLEGHNFYDFWDEEYSDEENIEFIIEQLVRFIKTISKDNNLLRDRLQQTEEELKKWKLLYGFDIYEEGMLHLAIHSLTVNDAFVGNPLALRGLVKKGETRNALQKSDKYIRWIERFEEICGDFIPTYDELLNMGVDLAKPTFVKIGYICRADMDILNLDKTLVDTIYNLQEKRLKAEGRYDLAKSVSDNKIDKALIYRVGSCQYFKDTINTDVWDLNNNGGHCFIKFINI